MMPCDRAWHACPAPACLTALNSGEAGLSADEAAARLRTYGPNSLPETPRRGPFLLFLSQFASPLIYLLLAAALVSLFVGERLDALFIMGVLLLNAMVGAVQEMRADASAEALRSLVPQTARVRRKGRAGIRDSVEIVPGDIVELESGKTLYSKHSDWVTPIASITKLMTA